MLSEGYKETENTRIEKDKENENEISMLYDFGVIIFEHVILESDKYYYSICWFNPKKVYDVLVEDKQRGVVDSFDTFNELPPNLSKLYSMIKGESVCLDDEIIKCNSHCVEYSL